MSSPTADSILLGRSIVTVSLNPTVDRIIEVPGFHVSGHLKGRLRSRLPAGKGINVSRALAALNVGSTAMGWVGRGNEEDFDRCIREAGATPRFTPIAGPSRENVTVIDPESRTETHIRDAGPTVTAAEIARIADELAAVADDRTLFVFTGSAAPGLTPAGYGELLDLCLQRGAAVAVDAYGEPLQQAVRRPIHLVKPNRLELADLAGDSVDDEAAILAAARSVQQRVPIVLVTLGDRGAYCLASGRVLRGCCPVSPARVRSTVGCGDAMLAGFLAAMCGPSSSVEDAFRQALAVAAASTMNERPATFAVGDLEPLGAGAGISRVD